jgi:hypothetical protein
MNTDKTCELESILEAAARITGGSRQENYGHPRPNHERIAILWNAYLDARAVPADPRGGASALPREASLRQVDVVMFMILLKIARELHTTKRDNFLDIIGYAKCGAQVMGHEP